MLFSKGLYTNSDSNQRNANAQWAEVVARRKYFNANERHIAAMQGYQANAAAVIPQDVYREFDNQTKALMRNDEGDVLLNDLIPLSRALDIGKIEYKFRKASDSGNAQTTLSGQTPVLMDNTQYAYDSAIIPVHQDGFGREWREMEGQRSEGFDALIDDQANSVRAVRRQMVDYILDGSDVTFNGTSWAGVRSDSRVASIDLGAGGLNIDFTSDTATAADIRDAFKSLRDTLRISNNAMGDITFYVSREIMTNFERYYADGDWAQGTLLKALLELSGVAAIKETAKLTGNQVLGMVLSNEFIQPLVGMSVNVMAIPRTTPFERYNFLTWGAMGLQIKTDFDGRTGVMYAAEA